MILASDPRVNTPYGEFENSQIQDDSELNQAAYANEVLGVNEPDYEAASIKAEMDQLEAFASDPANQAREAESRSDAQYAAGSNERENDIERRALVLYAKDVGRHIRANRDYELAA